MNHSKRLSIVFICLTLCLCSSIPNATAYNSALTAVCEIIVQINEGIIEDPQDIEDITIVVANPEGSDTHEYQTTEGPGATTSSGETCPSTYITSPSSTDTNQGDSIVGAGEGFDLNVTIPQGVEYMFRITMKTLVANQTIQISVSGYSNTISLKTTSGWGNNNIDLYVCLSNGQLTTVSASTSITDSMWLVSDDGPAEISLSGTRGKVTIFGQNVNLGDLEVQLIMKNGQAKPSGA